ncbi:MAG: TRAFs-binding domain-containing protein [Burkholderiales bacterium]
MALHVFVAMPFGVKEGIDFDRVYSELIKPALESAGFEPFRADEEVRAGDIRADMFQELLLADVVVADLSIDNPNVWYELGVRHALRARGVIPIACRPGSMPFDVYTDRKLHYHLKDGAPDSAHLDSDRTALAEMVKDTVAAWHGRKSSPVYHLLPYLKEPDWKTLRVGAVQEVWERQAEWERRVAVARGKWRPGDVIVLAEEAPAQVLRREAHFLAAKTLRQLHQPAFALEQVEKALALDPTDLASRQEKGILLGRLGRFVDAEEWLKAIANDHPQDAETCGLLGRLQKDKWIAAWRTAGATPDAMREAARLDLARLHEGVRAYAAGFRQDPRHYYSGINAATLLHLSRHLAGNDEEATLRSELEGGVRWSVRSALSKESALTKDFWARATLAELDLLTSDKPTTEKAYAHAVAAAEADWFALNSSWQQLDLLQTLGFRPDVVAAALGVIDRALVRLSPPWQPGKVFLFSGHMIDAPDRDVERFPEDMKALAAAAIGRKLDELGAGTADLALCEGACGGDLLFARAALDRGLRLELRLSFEEPEFLGESVAFAGTRWVDEYYEVKSSERTRVLVMPQELGRTPNRDAYERANVWLLYTALAWGPERVRFVALWDGERSGKRGGTDHMIDAVRKRSGRVYVIDATALLEETKRMRNRS